MKNLLAKIKQFIASLTMYPPEPEPHKCCECGRVDIIPAGLNPERPCAACWSLRLQFSKADRIQKTDLMITKQHRVSGNE